MKTEKHKEKINGGRKIDHKLSAHLQFLRSKSIIDWKPTQDQIEPKLPLLVGSRRNSYN